MLILALDDRQGLNDLEAVLRELLSSELTFRGYDSARTLLDAANRQGYDLVIADVQYRNRSGLLLLSELAFSRPRTNFVGAAAYLSERDAMTMHHLHGGYIQKPYDRETLADTLSHLRYPIKEAVQ